MQGSVHFTHSSEPVSPLSSHPKTGSAFLDFCFHSFPFLAISLFYSACADVRRITELFKQQTFIYFYVPGAGKYKVKGPAVLVPWCLVPWLLLACHCLVFMAECETVSLMAALIGLLIPLMRAASLLSDRLPKVPPSGLSRWELGV